MSVEWVPSRRGASCGTPTSVVTVPPRQAPSMIEVISTSTTNDTVLRHSVRLFRQCQRYIWLSGQRRRELCCLCNDINSAQSFHLLPLLFRTLKESVLPLTLLVWQRCCVETSRGAQTEATSTVGVLRSGLVGRCLLGNSWCNLFSAQTLFRLYLAYV
ncbi:hypothetical protein TcWFU_001781 [Taenia crassiceps]|uniref:Uncharacterized protein n=1 Tax=Taenia crassiceps TaxID=6207 RepID=A0ABR4Q342_9CEST